MDNFKIIQIKKIPVVMNIPHASIFVDDDFKKDFLLSTADLYKFSKEMADLYADELFSRVYNKTGALIAKLSRVVVDTERFWDNENEPMAKNGMGALYEKNGQGDVVRKINKTTYIHGLSIYSEYHHALDRLIKECLKQFGFCIILDCHTYPAKSRQYDLDKNKDRPEICLGTDKFHTPRLLFNSFKKVFSDRNYSVKENIPFKGTMVPSGYFKNNRNVFSLMIEVNRKLYMNERTHVKMKNFRQIVDNLGDCILYGIDEFLKEYENK